MELTKKQTTTLLFATQGIGALFILFFLTAYFGGLFKAYINGLPLTTTLNSEAFFIGSQALIGGILIVVLVIGIVFSAVFKRKD